MHQEQTLITDYQ
ncbi:hypothetical protein JL09_g6820 [Pichia kudriavzevii]|uniref:Uncharacterized protein n=1 Tax=Pichia kudriavzevii TaxID=4909 RepID=A0A099NIN0_PICKU|nr:hypothetical protein JL09_g6820 [Pichia kudriavzevii]